ncbi:MAG TPA: ABC transporter substrate-binding protein [Reyranella sp.]|nr:ABC transporter substrate-binding protein [Reyranella sp.]
MGAAALQPQVAGAQTSSTPFKVGLLIGAGSDARTYAFEAFRLGLRTQGFVEGQNLVIERRVDIEGTDESLSRAAHELAALSPAVVVAANTPPVIAMRQAAPATPIVMVAVGDPIAMGLIASLRHPSRTITGITGQDAELTGKRLALLKEVVRSVTRIGLLASPDNPVFDTQLANAEAVAKAHGIELLREDVHGQSDLDRAFASIVDRGGRAVMRLGGFRSREAIKSLASLAVEHRLPFCSDRLIEVQEGLLMSYGPGTAAMFQQAAGFVARILRGAQPGDLPVEPPAKYELALNMPTARALGIVFPAGVIARATAVVEA